MRLVRQFREDACHTLRATMTAREAAAYLGVSYWKLLELVRQKKVPHIRLDARVLFRREALDAWLAEQEAASVRRDEEKAKICRLIK